MKSFSLLRTNVGLTTNVKVLIDSKYKLYLESIESNSELSNTSFKKVQFNKDNYYDELIPHFYKNLPTDSAFYVKYDNDISKMDKDFSKQYDELYQCGAKNIIDNKNYSEEYEYFAPLYLSGKNVPKKFIIFRVDGSGLEKIDKTNILPSVINKFKTVKLFDLTTQSQIGQWLDKNFMNNDFFPLSPLEIDFKSLEFSKWNGIDYNNGGWVSKSLFMDNFLEDEKELYLFDKYIYDNYKNNKLVFPNILNLSFLFDDSPATPNSIRKWSINRYYGFYLDDMVLTKKVSPYIPPLLKDDVQILENNILYSPSGVPFENGWRDDRTYYIEYLGKYYKVEKYTETSSLKLNKVTNGPVSTDDFSSDIINKYRIISDISLKDKENLLNKNSIIIDSNNLILNLDTSLFNIEDFNSANLWVIEIDGIYHNIVFDGKNIKIWSDYAFSINEDNYKYWINNTDENLTKKVSLLVDSNNDPKIFNIYKLNLTNIKDFDTRIVDTEYSKYEYEKKYDITNTQESKMFMVNLNSKTTPKELDKFVFKNDVINVPVSSEYIANNEIFKIEDGDLTPLWRKNSNYCRWVFKNSISGNDYPYLLNNSEIFEDYNRTANTNLSKCDRSERNLDYFYTINSGTFSYLHHTLHVENNNESGHDLNFDFDFNKYLGISNYYINGATQSYNYDYFEYFFSRKTTYLNNTVNKNVKKYSLFNDSETSAPNITLFRGIKFIAYDVDSIKKTDVNIDTINLKTSNNFNDYKFSILLTSDNNGMEWDIIETYQGGQAYDENQIVIDNDILYVSGGDNNTSAPLFTLQNQSNWQLLNDTIFYNPNSIYSIGDIVFNNNEYYINDYSFDLDIHNFWYRKVYNINDVVIFKNQYYKSLIDNNIDLPSTSNWEVIIPAHYSWRVIELWQQNLNYILNDFVVYNHVLYKKITNINSNEIPLNSKNWERVYSIEQDTDHPYGSSKLGNNIVFMNNHYYKLKNNPDGKTLENGIDIYINKKWKNILLNIKINDNTIPFTRDCERDKLYSQLSNKLTAYNLTQCLNDLSNKFDFSDYVQYIIIDSDGSINRYSFNNNFEKLPHIIFTKTPQFLNIKDDTFITNPLSVNLIPKNKLNNSEINDPVKFNWFNNTHIANTIKNDDDLSIKDNINYNGFTNTTHKTIYRFEGDYMPLFYDIELFKIDNNTKYKKLSHKLELTIPSDITIDFIKNGVTYSTTTNIGSTETYKQIMDIVVSNNPDINFYYTIGDNLDIHWNDDLDINIDLGVSTKSIVETSEFSPKYGNYIFDTSLTNFGIMKEYKINKINRKGNILKLQKGSIYPMLDEYGYLFTDYFIFKSSWDFNYYTETILPNSKQTIINDIEDFNIDILNIGKPIYKL